jgi:hypothetical protein
MRHHQLYKAGKANRVLHQVHIWFGRILIILAIANGGTGIFLAGNAPPSGQKAYGTLAGIIGAVYIVLGALWYLNRTSNSGENSLSDPSEVERGVNREVKGPEVEGRVVEMVGVL